MLGIQFKKTITRERLMQVVHYDPETGVFTSRRTGRGIRTSKPVGSLTARGYHRMVIDGEEYRSHRLAWLYVYGVWPECEIDHTNGDKTDNRIANLRKATRSENQANLPVLSTNTTGFKGVCWNKKSKKFQAGIKKDGRSLHLGLYESAEAAGEAYRLAASQIFKEFARGA